MDGDWSPGIHKPVLEQTLQLTADDSTNDDSNVDQGAKDTSVSAAAKDAALSTAGDSAKDATVSAAGEIAIDVTELNKSTNDSSVKQSDMKDTTGKDVVIATKDSTAANAEASNVSIYYLSLYQSNGADKCCEI